MKLSAPIYRLKRHARVLARKSHIPLHQALDRIAVAEGFASWSLLAVKLSARAPVEKLYARLAPGDLILLGARPGHGKTLLSLELAVQAMKAGHRAMFFTLEYTEVEMLDRLRAIGVEPADYNPLFGFDNSDAICADYIIGRLSDMPPGTLVVIDYLQLLDQKRETPELMAQVQVLQAFARDKGLILVFISQIDRSYDPIRKPCPDLTDVRLPNALDLALFSKTCFLNNGDIRFEASGG
jgi:replicative DNA helicase